MFIELEDMEGSVLMGDFLSKKDNWNFEVNSCEDYDKLITGIKSEKEWEEENLMNLWDLELLESEKGEYQEI